MTADAHQFLAMLAITDEARQRIITALSTTAGNADE